MLSLAGCTSGSIAVRTVPRVHAGFRKKQRRQSAGGFRMVVETRRIELPTFALRTRRSPS